MHHAMMRIRLPLSTSIALVAVCASIFLTGCAAFRHRQHPAQFNAGMPVGPRRVGTVAVVNDELHFALIDVGSLYTPPPGTALKSFSAGAETSILAVGAERQRPFIAADIVKGEPKVGDEVRE